MPNRKLAGSRKAECANRCRSGSGHRARSEELRAVTHPVGECLATEERRRLSVRWAGCTVFGRERAGDLGTGHCHGWLAWARIGCGELGHARQVVGERARPLGHWGLRPSARLCGIQAAEAAARVARVQLRSCEEDSRRTGAGGGRASCLIRRKGSPRVNARADCRRRGTVGPGVDWNSACSGRTISRDPRLSNPIAGGVGCVWRRADATGG